MFSMCLNITWKLYIFTLFLKLEPLTQNADVCISRNILNQFHGEKTEEINLSLLYTFTIAKDSYDPWKARTKTPISWFQIHLF